MLNSTKEPLAYLKRNTGVNLLYHYVQNYIMLKGLTMKIKNINLVKKVYTKIIIILIKKDLKKYLQTKIIKMFVLIVVFVWLIII